VLRVKQAVPFGSVPQEPQEPQGPGRGLALPQGVPQGTNKHP